MERFTIPIAWDAVDFTYMPSNGSSVFIFFPVCAYALFHDAGQSALNGVL